MPLAHLHGQSIYYAARGETGAPFVFIHGSGSSHLVWNQQVQALARLARVYAIDLPGHGRSTRPGRKTVRDYADAVLAFIDDRGFEQAIVAGHSLGGAIAQTLALEVPERLLGLVLIGTGARLRVLPTFLQGVLENFPATAEQVTEAEFAPGADEYLKRLSKEQMLKCDPKVVHDDFAACDAFDVMARIPQIRTPSLVLCGREDRMTPVKYSEFLATNIPNAQLAIIESAGHMVMIEQPAALNRALANWLEQLPMNSQGKANI